MKNQSHYDPTRPTVGAIYRDLHLTADPRDIVVVGDLNNEMMKGLVEDINDGIATKPFGDRPWYIMIHEKKDLQMKDAFLRRVLHFPFRPYPEDDTTVFWHDPVQVETRFCWSLPHWSDMYNILMNENLFDHALVEEVKAWRREDLTHFGFMKDEMGKWMPNLKFKDKAIESFRKSA
jgi:hypothetical protein